MTTAFFQHPQSICETNNIGQGTRIWAFAHVLPGAKVGSDCNICDGVFIENDVLIGDRVTIKPGVQVYDGLRIEDDVFIGPNVTFTNDHFPRSKQYPEKFLNTIIRKRASIGANATILPGIEIGEGAMIGAGSVVVRSVPPYAVVVGNPARITGYAKDGRSGDVLSDKSTGLSSKGLVELKLVRDLRGNLTVGEFPDDIPFVPKRYFLITDVPSEEVRGEHAHRVCEQFIICIRGSCHAICDDGVERRSYILNRQNVGLYIPPMVWSTQYRYTRDAMLLVFASEHYDPSDYIRSYDEFVSERGI